MFSHLEGNVTAEHREKAVMLAQNAPLLRRKLKTKTFKQACLLRGVDIKCLRPRSISSFKTSTLCFCIRYNFPSLVRLQKFLMFFFHLAVPNRAQELSPDEQQFHYNEYEEERLHLLGSIVISSRTYCFTLLRFSHDTVTVVLRQSQ